MSSVVDKISPCPSFRKRGSKPYDDVHPLRKSDRGTVVKNIFLNWIRSEITFPFGKQKLKATCRPCAKISPNFQGVELMQRAELVKASAGGPHEKQVDP